jgi:hypothetical protein
MAMNIKNDKVERLAEALDFLEKVIWPNIPKEFLGRRITKKEREQILGYGKGGKTYRSS